ncbi:hypothetical protein [Bremerella sp.]|uniref:hypothetical protein n=1 Tax=Bremerella sp. TaxID=2795602 RepID=UPI00391D5919
MRKLSFVALLCVLAATIGCKQSSSTSGPDQTASSSAATDDHGHDHAEGDAHDHSVEGHAHGVGPHDGTIADWGGGTYHVEFTVDHDKQQATVYILGSDEKTPTPIDPESIELSITDPEMQVVLNADPQEGDPEGKSSRYVGTHEKLGVVQEYAGTMTGVVDGTPYSGDFKEEPHGDHEH